MMPTVIDVVSSRESERLGCAVAVAKSGLVIRQVYTRAFSGWQEASFAGYSESLRLFGYQDYDHRDVAGNRGEPVWGRNARLATKTSRNLNLNLELLTSINLA